MKLSCFNYCPSILKKNPAFRFFLLNFFFKLFFNIWQNVNLNTIEIKYIFRKKKQKFCLFVRKKNSTFFFSKIYFFLKITFFRSVQIYMKDAEYVETDEKLIFRISIFELWSFLYSKHSNFRWIFTITRENKSEISFSVFHSFQNVS